MNFVEVNLEFGKAKLLQDAYMLLLTIYFLDDKYFLSSLKQA